MIKKLPVPICGLALSLAALGNLLQTYSMVLRYCLGGLSFLILALFTIRLLTDRDTVKTELNNPVVFGVFSTYPMTWVLLSAYVKPLIGTVAVVIWAAALLGHLVLIGLFVKKYVLKFKIQTVFPTWFVMFVGYVVGSVTAPAMGMQAVGQILYYVGFASCLVVVALGAYRVFKIKGVPEPATPTYAIFTAPVSLCLAGYLSAFETKSAGLVYFMLALSLVLYIGVLISLVKLLRLKFYPSFSAFTFPLVISAIAQKMSVAFLGKLGIVIPGAIITITTLIAVAIVLYVLVRYIAFLATNPAKTSAKG